MDIPSVRGRLGAWGLAGALTATVLALAPAAGAGSLRFFGNGISAPGQDRVTIPIAGSVNVGAGDFTIEWWMRALPGDNASTAVTCGVNDGWIHGNIVFDRDIFGDGVNPSTFGDFGVSLSDGRLAFGVSQASGNATTGTTICGVTDVTDGAWHHVAAVRHAASGELRLYVDGILDALGEGPAAGPPGNVSYQVGRASNFPDSDPFLVIGAEKHDAGASFPSYRGWIDEVRLSTVRRYTADTFTRPATPFAADGSTAALYHMDEGAGTTVGDASGNGNDGTRQVGGSPAGPAWSMEEPPLTSSRRIALETVSGLTSLNSPVAIAHANDGRLFVVLQGGQIVVRQPDGTTSTFLDISAGAPVADHRRVRAGGERGLLGLAFHPNHASNRYFYVYYTRSPDGALVIARYRAILGQPNVADPDSETLLIDPPIDHSAHGNHNGGALAFGGDGYLYAAVGDGGGGGDPDNNAQNLATQLGKILRLDVDAASPHIPPTNPFADSLIWAYGLRNPWRIAFDRANDDLFIADVGQGNREEINLQRGTGDAGENGGRNYGWRRMEGFACYNPGSGCQTGSLVLPVMDYAHTGGRCSVTGGYRYRGAGLPFLHGVYVFGDFCSGEIWAGVEAGNGVWSRVDLLDTSLGISSFGEDAAGELYVADLFGGAVYRIVAAPPRLVVTRTGAGTGTVSGAGPISCTPTCQADYATGTPVTLTAATGASSVFAGWSGSCAGTGSCQLTMSGDRAVTATFLPQPALQFSAASYTVGEGSSLTVTVQRLLTTAGTVTVDYAIVPGSATAPPAVAADFGGPGGGLTGTLTFTPGQSSRTFTVTTVNDTLLEGPETILLALLNPTGGAVLGSPSTAVATILDNDTASAIQFSQSEYSVSESSATATLTVTRSGGASNAQVAWQITGGTAVAGLDFGGPTSGTVTFGSGVTSVPLPITLLRQGDTLADGQRTAVFTLSSPTPAGLAVLGGRTTTTLRITDNDVAGTLQFSPAALTATEAAGSPVNLTVTRTGGAASGVGVTWTVTGGTAVLGTDFTTPSGATGALVFGPGTGSQTIPITLVNRPGAQGTRTVVLTLSTPTGGAALGGLKTATLTITDDEIGLRFDAASFTASEGSASATITVVRTGPTATAVTVDYATGPPSGGTPATASSSPGTCDAAADYRPVSGTLTFGAGTTSRTFAVPLCRDNVIDGEKRVGLVLGNPGPGGAALLGTPAAADLRISDADAVGTVQFAAANFNVSESSGSVTLIVTRTGGTAQGITVGYATGDPGDTATPSVAPGSCSAGADYRPVAGTLTFSPGQTSRTFSIPLCGDAVVEGPELFAVKLAGASPPGTLGTPSTATVTIADDDAGGVVQWSADAYSVTEGTSTATLTVLRTGGGAGAVTVPWQIDASSTAVLGTDYASPVSPNPLVFGAGQNSASLTVPILNDALVDGSRTLVVTLGAPAGGAALGARTLATLTIRDDEPSLRFSGPTFSTGESSGTATVTVIRDGPTGTAVTVHVQTTGAGTAQGGGACGGGVDFTTTDVLVTFGVGQNSRPATIPLCPDTLADGTVTVGLALASPTGATLGTPNVAALTVTENDVAGTVQFAAAAATASEAQPSGILTVTRGAGSASGVTVAWTITGDSTAVASVDYTGPTSGVLTFALNEMSQSLTIPPVNRPGAQGPRRVVVQLGPAGGGGGLGGLTTATLWILDAE